ncbi:MAG: hypothetical protein LUB56_01230 [Coprobacillus sp.]|nr:hypothetical protein [Coprobacillus sp.]
MKGKKLFLLALLLPLVTSCGTIYPPSYWPAIEIGIEEDFTDILEVYIVSPTETNEDGQREVEYYYTQTLEEDDNGAYAIDYVYETASEIRYKKIVDNFHGNDQNGALVCRFYNSESASSYWVYIYDIYAVTPELEEGQAYFTGNYAWYNLYIFIDEIQGASTSYFPFEARKTYYI